MRLEYRHLSTHSPLHCTCHSANVILGAHEQLAMFKYPGYIANLHTVHTTYVDKEVHDIVGHIGGTPEYSSKS